MAPHPTRRQVSLESIVATKDLFRIVQCFAFGTLQGTEVWLLLRQISRSMCKVVDADVSTLSCHWMLTFLPLAPRDEGIQKRNDVVIPREKVLTKHKSEESSCNKHEKSMIALLRLLGKVPKVGSISVTVSSPQGQVIKFNSDLCRKELPTLLKNYNTTTPVLLASKNSGFHNAELLMISKLLSRNFGVVRSLNFTGTRSIWISSILGVSSKCTYLDTLNLSLTKAKNVNKLMNCSSLQTLILRRTQVTNVAALARCVSLNTLDLSECYKLNDLSALGKCISLQHLNLRLCKGVDGISPLSTCKSLRTLDVSRTMLSSLNGLKECVSLRQLNVEGTAISDISVLPSNVSLCKLSIEGTYVSDITALGQCHALQELDISWCKQILDLTSLGSCELLLSLDLTGTNISDISVLAKCQALRTLNLSWCYKIHRVGKLIKCSSLQMLNLSWCKNVSDVDTLAQSKSLHTLNLSSCKHISDVKAFSECESLKVLYLSRCPQIDDVRMIPHVSIRR